MDKELWIALTIVFGITIYAFTKVSFYMRKSDEQWHKVDKSKLKTLDDED